MPYPDTRGLTSASTRRSVPSRRLQTAQAPRPSGPQVSASVDMTSGVKGHGVLFLHYVASGEFKVHSLGYHA